MTAHLRPAEVEAALIAPLYARTGTLLIGHAASLILSGLAVLRLGGALPICLLIANLCLSAGRSCVLLRMRPALAACTPDKLLAWRRPYQALGLAWSVICGATCAECIACGQDELTRLWAVALALGTAAGITSRNAGTPRYALAQIGLWLAPMLPAWPMAGSWGWGASAMLCLYIAAMASILRRQHGELIQLISAERHSRAIQQDLAERESDLQTIFNNAYAGFADIDVISGKYVRVNAEYCRMTGRSEAELLALPDSSPVVHPDDVPTAWAKWSEFHRTGQPYESENRVIRPDGSVIHCKISVSAASTSEGHPIRSFFIVQDVTAQKAAEAALRDSEEMLRLSLDIGRIGSFRRDLVSDLIYFGAQTRVMHGLPAGDAPIPSAELLHMLLPDDAQRAEHETLAALARRQPIMVLDYRFTHPDGGVRHFETRSRIDYRADGTPVSCYGVMIDVTERRAAEARIAHLAHHDPLTGLANRTLLRIRLDEALARAMRGERFAVMCLDLDHFKIVNDTLGHPVGDSLLRAVTARLQAVIRPTDTIARLGGDEFACIMSSLKTAIDASTLAERLITTLSAPYEIDGHRVIIGASIGLAIVPDDGVDPDMVLRHADTALYGAKAAGRGGFRFFEAEMDARLQARRSLEMDLRAALDDEAFELFYQPLVNAASRDLLGFEALLRWRHPTRGLVPPDRFIPLAESIGLIVPIGAWVLHRACAEAVTWPGTPRVAVNLSVVQFGSPTLVETIGSALDRSGLDPARLELEITESVMLKDTEIVLKTLHRLKALGIGVAMDDFGTGYSSLSYLQRFPFDKVKIDRSFIAHLGETRESAAIVGAVIDLCRSLDMRTTAEGVETEAQLAALIRTGCTEAQGYLFSRPQPASEIPALIESFTKASRVTESDRYAPAKLASFGNV